MTVSVENLGVLERAEFELGDLTLICGGNNTGKTYATYALFGFLSNWRNLLSVEVPDSTIHTLLKDGVARLGVDSYIDQAQDVLRRGCDRYAEILPTIFAARSSRFEGTRFLFSLAAAELSALLEHRDFKYSVGSKNAILSLSKGDTEDHMVLSWLTRGMTWPFDTMRQAISDGIVELLFDDVLPRAFMTSTERTGATVFRSELDYEPNLLLDEVIQPESKSHLMDSLVQNIDYPLPVRANVNFARRIEQIVKADSFLARDHPQVLDEFSDILGGDYRFDDSGAIYFQPRHGRVRLSMDESSSSVRSLLHMGLYLRHVASSGDLMMVDEPELNLHPENQRRIARLFARLVKLGVRVLATTHSDYIARELSTLIMLNGEKPYLTRIAEKRGYHADELLAVDQVRVYIAERALMKIGDQSRSRRRHTLVASRIDEETGIEARSFDETINAMNEIQDAIVWGENE